MSNTLVAIDDQFNSRMVRTDNQGPGRARPVNPFASKSTHNSTSLEAERKMAPEVSGLTMVGAVYLEGGVSGTVERVVETKANDHILFDQRNNTHPDTGTKLHTTNKLPTDGTREK